MEQLLRSYLSLFLIINLNLVQHYSINSQALNLCVNCYLKNNYKTKFLMEKHLDILLFHKYNSVNIDHSYFCFLKSFQKVYYLLIC